MTTWCPQQRPAVWDLLICVRSFPGGQEAHNGEKAAVSLMDESLTEQD